jgi:RNA polymerase sigma-70 factor (ECF subfamily)
LRLLRGKKHSREKGEIMNNPNGTGHSSPEGGQKGSTKTEQERVLLKQLECGDPEALEQLIRDYHRRLFSLAMSICRNHEDAEEVVQNVYMKIVTKIQGFEGRSSLSTWLFRVTVNESLMKIRRHKKDDLFVSMEGFHSTRDWSGITSRQPDRTPREVLEDKEIRERIGRAVEALPTNYQKVFFMRHIDGRSLKETSQALNISVAATKSRLIRCKAFLRAQLVGGYSFAV